jgi:hypothetical protein
MDSQWFQERFPDGLAWIEAGSRVLENGLELALAELPCRTTPFLLG